MVTRQHKTLKVTIYNWDKFTHNHFMGQVREEREGEISLFLLFLFTSTNRRTNSFCSQTD